MTDEPAAVDIDAPYPYKPGEHDHCIYCGRALIDVEERSTLYDAGAGERGTVVWRQCPRFPRNGLVALLRGWCHESFQRDRPMIGREYR